MSEIPLSHHLKNLYDNVENKKKIWELILCSGEDYQLFFSVNPKKKNLLKKKKIKNIKRVGYFQKGSGLVIYDENKRVVPCLSWYDPHDKSWIPKNWFQDGLAADMKYYFPKTPHP